MIIPSNKVVRGICGNLKCGKKRTLRFAKAFHEHRGKGLVTVFRKVCDECAREDAIHDRIVAHWDGNGTFVKDHRKTMEKVFRVGFLIIAVIAYYSAVCPVTDCHLPV